MTDETKDRLKFAFTTAITPPLETREAIGRWWFYGLVIVTLGLLVLFNWTVSLIDNKLNIKFTNSLHNGFRSRKKRMSPWTSVVVLAFVVLGLSYVVFQNFFFVETLVNDFLNDKNIKTIFSLVN